MTPQHQVDPMSKPRQPYRRTSA